MPDNITNPKTLKKWQKALNERESAELFAKEKGYAIEKRSTSTWSFSRYGRESVLGFDSYGEVLSFIVKYEPSPDAIFPSYK